MEIEIFQLLNFDITYPSAFWFFEILSLYYNLTEMELFYGCFLLYHLTISPNFNKFFPSVIALAVTLVILKENNYKEHEGIFSVTGMKESEISVKNYVEEITSEEKGYHFSNVNLNAAIDEYSHEYYHFVSKRNLNTLQSKCCNLDALNAANYNNNITE